MHNLAIYEIAPNVMVKMLKEQSKNIQEEEVVLMLNYAPQKKMINNNKYC